MASFPDKLSCHRVRTLDNERLSMPLENSIMRLFLDWRRARPRLVPVRSFLAALLVVMLWPRERATRLDFAKIHPGMSQAELQQLLGMPEFDVLETGLVNDSENYSTNNHLTKEEKRERGFREYQHQQWSSPEISIVVISDLQGRAVCRYAGPGHGRAWIAFLRYWLRRWF